MSERRRKVYHAINHPIRRRIVELLGRNEPLRSSDLKDFLDIGPGKLYYHLKNLGNLIEQDENRKYKLSQKGKEAYQLLVVGENLPVKSLRSLPRFLEVLNSIFLPNALFSRLYKYPASHLPESFLLLLFGGWLSHISGLQPILLFFTLQSQPLYWTIFRFLVGWLIIYTVDNLHCCTTHMLGAIPQENWKPKLDGGFHFFNESSHTLCRPQFFK
ncbi:MAG: helix-turn-helix domain-containing protein [Thermoproteota archaeon]